jgi:hypothetical protein
MIKWTVFIPIIAIAISATGGFIYRTETTLLATQRQLEKLQIKDYRQHRDVLRSKVEFLGRNVADLESVLEHDPAAFGGGSGLIVRQRQKAYEQAKERLENYVEENKHYGSSD